MNAGNGTPVNATFCVTGSTGYIGSWLVCSLLRRGFTVHATARDTGKASYLLSLPNASNRLKIFKSDLSEEGSFDEAVKGCVGVFHVAASMELSVEHEEAIGARCDDGDSSEGDSQCPTSLFKIQVCEESSFHFFYQHNLSKRRGKGMEICS
ncbi:dihydroflavonol 4-reductase-like isoform X2 [Phalaenopsis equestris]|uniref:dihydroflavonol 4-reductase-like isoform X2 n=1 Tax=Phalaenopsis equestris TaxID=78828 RepID=UPI0009E48774|nr:dihydroflavonol 4-reductase-like isoform X2 [Phalaenopsis equestris]